MARIKLTYKPSDYPAGPDGADAADVKALFDTMFPGAADPTIGPSSGGFAVVARDPKLALKLYDLSRYIVVDLRWTQRKDLRELAVQALNYHFKCAYSYESHVPVAEQVGVSAALQSAIPYWETTRLFDEEQRLVVEYSLAVCAGTVTDELSARVVAKYGERGTAEFATIVAWWSFWAMIINAIRP